MAGLMRYLKKHRRGADGSDQLVVPVMLESDALFGGATMPTRAHANDAGFDMYVSKRVTVDPGAFADIPSGVHVQLPEGTWGLLTGRSSTIRNRGLLVVQGVIDEGYRGELFSAVWNLTDHPVTVEAGERIAQLIVMPNVTAECVLVQVEELGYSERGASGFGSSGK